MLTKIGWFPFIFSIFFSTDDYVPQKIRSRSGSRDSIQALVSRRRRSSSSILDFDYLRSGSEEVDVCVKDQIRKWSILFFKMNLLWS